MQLKIGIVGLPNVGKSTLFKLLTKQEVNIANYPFCTIDPNVGIAPVPDERLAKLAMLSKSAKIIPAVVEFYDIAGLVKNAHKGEGLGNQFLAHIRDVGIVLLVLRCFADDNIIHVEKTVDPLRDWEIILTELALKDLETTEKRLDGLEKEIKAGKKEAAGEKEVLETIKKRLSDNNPIDDFAEEPAVRQLGLLSAKKRLILLNGKETEAPPPLVNKIKNSGDDFVVADLSAEALISEAKGDLSAQTDGTLPLIIKKSYQLLNLISFFTSGPEETRAWTITRGTLAPQAAGVIHSDFENKFIRAEVASYNDLMTAGSWSEVKNRGLMRLEGKQYLVQDGDVVFIRHG